MERTRLIPKHQKFVAEYLIDFDGKNAAIRAGYAPRNAHGRAHKLLRRPAIAAAVEKELAAHKEKRRITGDRVLIEYARMAFANIRDFVDWGPQGITLRSKDDVSEADTAAIAELQPNGGNGKVGKLKLYDKKAALDALARHLGLFDPHARLAKKDQTVDGKEARQALRDRLLKLARSGGN